MCFRFTRLITLLLAITPLAARADLITIDIEGEFYSVGDQVTVEPHGLEYNASFVFDSAGAPDQVTSDRQTYRDKLVSGRLSVGDLVATFGSDVTNVAAVDTRQYSGDFITVLEVQIGSPSSVPPPPIVQTGGAGIGLLSRVILLFNSGFSQDDTRLSLDEVLAEAHAWSFTPIVEFRDIPGVGYYGFYSTVTSLTLDRQSVASVSVPSSALLVVCALVMLRRVRARGV